MSKRVVQQLSSSRRTSSRYKNKYALLQANTSSIQLQHPTSNERSDWEPYWEALDQPWRCEPEIDKERQDYLALRRSLVPDIEKGNYPFKDISLGRADVEWLLMTYKEENQGKQQKSLDLRGADLRKVNLCGLPLSGICGGLDIGVDWDVELRPEVLKAAAAHFEGASLDRANLEGACLSGAHLEGASLYEANLQQAKLDDAYFRGADLSKAHLDKANLMGAHLENAYFRYAHLEGVDLWFADMKGADFKYASMDGVRLNEANLVGVNLCKASLKGADFYKAHAEGADLSDAHLEEASFMFADMQGINLSYAHLEGANLEFVHLEQSKFNGAYLQGANLMGAHLEQADLSIAHLEQANLSAAFLQGANLRGVFFDTATRLQHVALGDKKFGYVSLVDVRWGGVNMALTKWTAMNMLGDEYEARRFKISKGQKDAKGKRLDRYERAVRANRQLALALQSQGLNEVATHYAYRAQKLQRVVFRQQRKFGQYLFSLFLDVLAGYGYKPLQSVIAYLVIIFGFMGLYLLNAHFVTPHLRWDEALVLSVSSFHGRGFFAQDITLGDTYARLAAAEAIVGLLVELSFIATFTQRYFGK